MVGDSIEIRTGSGAKVVAGFVDSITPMRTNLRTGAIRHCLPLHLLHAVCAYVAKDPCSVMFQACQLQNSALACHALADEIHNACAADWLPISIPNKILSDLIISNESRVESSSEVVYYNRSVSSHPVSCYHRGAQGLFLHA